MSGSESWGVLRRPKVSSAALTTRARARAGALASAQAMPAESMAGPGDEAGGRSGGQSHLCRALVCAVNADSLRAFFRGHIHLLQLQQELSGRHRWPPRARGVLFFFC
eukprot:scaffold3819_cov107-Isochrysis_galbana.AAC.10